MILRVVFVLIVSAGLYLWHKSAEKNIVYSAKEKEVRTQQDSTKALQPQGNNQESGEQAEREKEQEKEREKERESETNADKLPESISNAVPFVAQAPLAQWDDKRFQDACEEASILMAYQWVGGDQELSNEGATATLEKIFEAQKPLFGEDTIDTSLSDTALLMEEFFDYEPQIIEDITLDDMLQALAKDQIIIIPTDGTKLKNPYFSGDGPDRHMLVVTGYDQAKREFTTNDPGTKRGKEFNYDYDLLYGAIRDYKTGIKEPIEDEYKNMMVVEKS